MTEATPEGRGAPIVVRGVIPGDPPCRVVMINGDTVGFAHSLFDVIQYAREAGIKDLDLDDPGMVRWVGGDQWKWTP